MREPMLPAAEGFVERVRALFAEDLDDEARWTKAREHHRALLADPALKESARGWPNCVAVDGKASNLLFYEDPDYGFVINALVKEPGAATPIHDHGESWTLYGVIDGGETVVRYARADDGPRLPERAEIELVGEHEVKPGHIDFVPPWEIHAEYNGPRRTVAVIVRSRRSGTFVQNRFDPETGKVQQFGGPVQIPYRLG